DVVRGERGRVGGGDPAPVRGGRRQVDELAGEDRGLQPVQPAVAADPDVLVVIGALGTAVVGQRPDPRGEVRVVGDDGAAVAPGAEVLARVEAERGCDAVGAGDDRAAVGGGAVG